MTEESGTYQRSDQSSRYVKGINKATMANTSSPPLRRAM
jgi:hypothetical protein